MRPAPRGRLMIDLVENPEYTHKLLDLSRLQAGALSYDLDDMRP